MIKKYIQGAFMVNKKFIIMCLFGILIFSLNDKEVRADINNKDIVTDTLNGNHLFTSKFERANSSWCTAIAVGNNSFLTSAHCIEFKDSKEPLGYVYPALSGASMPLSYFAITEGITYKENSQVRVDDIAIVKSSDLNTSFNYYMKDKELKIKVVDKVDDLVGKNVYTIGYASDTGNNYQIKRRGAITKNWNNAFKVDVSASGGQSGSGLYLEDTNELIGILEGGDKNTAFFTPITKEIKTWIDNNK
ncbi:trypsin-like peptidase domain-containing protein [Mammaliicoccus stepanovicii]|nr:trypsin-like peptidase domain-containing protein [Mammaliicoccus stepanovicii]